MTVLGSICRTLPAGMLVAVLVACGTGEPEPATKSLSPEEQALADIVKMRRANFKDLGAAFKAIGDELKAGRPSSTTVVFSIKSLNQYARDMENWFPEGSGPELGVKTDAKSEIWSDDAEFAQAMANFKAAVSDLTNDAEDPATIPIRFQSAGKTCKACHDQFREEDR
ncbi:cytochrome c signal peptide protein [Hyphomonas adhaerens MHS-3]|uniref:Cytochrome c signal peptide protein n=1 Tax=Hyphomonas adhaerens MHS-3 TaxID=1280949 RepID=A0A069E2S8_9PROT|nr:cytochrome c [Hyphomonas adhaerens]KCZ84188.1 cytochrome c signal peptide protein [Hyphomonas adhaerens MHS-3]